MSDTETSAQAKHEDLAGYEDEVEVKYSASTRVPGKSLLHLSYDLNKDLNNLKSKYGNKYVPLLNRSFTDIKIPSPKSFSIMQFNMLADGMSGSYFLKQNAKTFLNVDKECLQWTYRGLRLLEEMTRFKPDIICLEECDQFPFIQSYLTAEYECHWCEKKTSAIGRAINAELSKELNAALDMSNDGVAIMFKRKKFNICGAIQAFNGENNAKVCALAIPLQYRIADKNGNFRKFLLIATHLKSTKSLEGEKVRVRQIASLMNKMIKNVEELPIILCCDLNANPVTNQKGYPPLCYEYITTVNGLGYDSVYKLKLGDELPYTTYKLRESGVAKHVLDYIFINNAKALKISAVLQLPEDTDSMIPNWYYPSDHYSIMAEFSWTKSGSNGKVVEEVKNRNHDIERNMCWDCIII